MLRKCSSEFLKQKAISMRNTNHCTDARPHIKKKKGRTMNKVLILNILNISQMNPCSLKG